MTERRKALGRGLGALISSASSSVTEQSPQPSEKYTPNSVIPRRPETPEIAGLGQELKVEEIDPNPDQPRRIFDPGELESLAASILRYGIIQPVVVRRAGDRYELIVGERRWRASRAAGLVTIPAVVADMAPQDRLEVALVENVQRHDLNPIELAHAYRALMDAGASQDQVGQKVSQDRSSVANHMRLLDLSPDQQADVEAGRLSMGHAKALLQLSDPRARSRLRDRVIREGLSVRATEKLAKHSGSSRGKRSGGPRVESLDPDLTLAIEALQRHYQARVHLNGDAKKGRIEIEYFDAEELQRILALMMGAQ